MTSAYIGIYRHIGIYWQYRHISFHVNIYPHLAAQRRSIDSVQYKLVFISLYIPRLPTDDDREYHKRRAQSTTALIRHRARRAPVECLWCPWWSASLLAACLLSAGCQSAVCQSAGCLSAGCRLPVCCCFLRGPRVPGLHETAWTCLPWRYHFFMFFWIVFPIIFWWSFWSFLVPKRRPKWDQKPFKK